MISDKQWAERCASRARYVDTMTRERREAKHALLVAGTHTFMCSPMEFNARGRFKRLDPGPIGGPDCVCRGYAMRYVGPNGPEDLRDMQVVSAATRVRTSRVNHITLERLLARLDFLRVHITRSREWAEQREPFRARVREIVSIERELDRRHVDYRRVSRRAWA